MDNNPPCILQVNTQDCTGGAARIAWNLFKGLERKGKRSNFAVGTKESLDPAVFEIPNNKNRNNIARFFNTVGTITRKIPVLRRYSAHLTLVGQPVRYRDYLNGFEDFDFPGTRILPEMIPGFSPDIIHCHNLHGGYFDLRELPAISRKIPVVLTLHDAWLFSGHCAHSFDCKRWKTGCGNCPNLTIYPAIRKDATAENWIRKQEIFSKSHLYVSTPCQWLMDKVNISLMKPAIIESQVIPNGVDLNTFRPYDKSAAREELRLPQESSIILFAANGIRNNPWKDYRTLRSAINIVFTNNPNSKILFIALGEKASSEKTGNASIDFVPYQNDPIKVARYYQAADIYIHAARVDTFPNTIIEALACGTPVVATSVGGIPEQIDDGSTGFLVPQGNAAYLAEKIQILLDDKLLRQKMGKNSSHIAREKFDGDKQVDAYILWYEKILNQYSESRFSE
jgi:glycosyltransferase involved in cell wall biosynthesis